MLIEIWERLRGYNKWIQTEATIESSKLEDLGFWSFRKDRSLRLGVYDLWQSKCDIGWTDASGASHTAGYAVSERSPLFQMFEGQTISIRYNPANPDKYYIRELFKHRASFFAFYMTVLLFNSAVLVAMLVTFSIWASRHFR